MTTSWQGKGLLDQVDFPKTLPATVVEPSPDPRIHGYSVQAELGHHASFLDVVWLSFTAELPTTSEREAFSRAMTWLSPVHVGEGPSHAAVLAKVAGAPTEVLPAIACVALGQQLSAELADLTPLFDWLHHPVGAVPDLALEPAPTEGQRAGWERLCADAERWFDAPTGFGRAVWRRQAAAWALLFHLGFRDAPRRQAMATLARLPVILAEAACAPASVKQYPTLTPAYVYEEAP
ncbi:MAG: hypothetical protein JNM69_30230 [Archangium sp.]|nr:hypothetical protein [Archangium sp.]